MAEDATFSLYQAADEEGEVSLWNLGEAIELAIEHEIDILNLSYGEFKKDCFGGQCPFCLAVQEAIENDITVVVSSGNCEPDRPSVLCPGLVEDVICVGGMVVECDNDSDEIPVGAYQLPNKGISAEPTDCVYCGQRGCEDGIDDMCISNIVERPWAGNTSKVGDKPDVLAPSHIVTEDSDDQPTTTPGTSFAAPFVTGSLAIIFSDLLADGFSLPNPYQARQSVSTSTADISGSDIGKLNVVDVISGMEDRLSATSNAD